MRHFLVSIMTALTCFSAVPAFAGGPAGPLVITDSVFGVSTGVPLNGTLTVMGTVTNTSGSPVTFDMGSFTNLSGCIACFDLQSLIDNTTLPGGGSTSPGFYLFSIQNLGTPGTLAGQFQVFNSFTPQSILGMSDIFTTVTTQTAVPEPTTLLLLGTGLAGLGGLIWRRQRLR